MSPAAVVSWDTFEHADQAEILQALSCNIAAPMLLTRLVLPDMRRRGVGTIVNVSSVCVALRALPLGR